MPFDLEIVIAGMCLLVRDSETDPRMLHILLPAITAKDKHYPRLLYLKRYECPDLAKDSMEKMEIDLASGKELDLTSLTSSNRFRLKLPRKIYDFEMDQGRFADRALLTGALADKLLFRMRLAAGQHGGAGPSGYWRFKNRGRSRRMALWVTWRLKNVRKDGALLDALPLTFKDGESHKLTPIEEDGVNLVRLFLLHVTKDEIPETVPRKLSPPKRLLTEGTAADHFESYYPLLYPLDEKLLPEFDSLKTLAKGTQARQGGAADRQARGTEFTCMIATAPTQS